MSGLSLKLRRHLELTEEKGRQTKALRSIGDIGTKIHAQV